LVRYVKEQRKCVAGEMAAFLKLERKEHFKEWGLLSETEGRRDAGMDRDTTIFRWCHYIKTRWSTYPNHRRRCDFF